jgi:ADP-dependent NAD(P)H-hydrate dehydratase / NAD(P)H-hydrate epimerase
MKIVTAAEMREIDRLTTEKYGIPSLTLMENAGSAVAEFAQKHFEFNSVCVVCGKGNNGGDGFVAARKLHEAGKTVSIIILAKAADELSGDAAEMFKKMTAAPLWVAEETQFEKAEIRTALHADVIIDAILGTGFKPPIQGVAARAVQLIGESAAAVLSVDLPSGADADSEAAKQASNEEITPDAILTFTAPKPAHVFRQLTDGPVAVVEIGSPAEVVFEISKRKQDVFSIGELGYLFPPRTPDANKGQFGHILIIGGSVGKAGAAAMAGMAASASGAGLVTIASAKSAQPTIASFAPELMTEALPETNEGTLSREALPRLQKLIEGKDCVAIGPGLSRDPETAALTREIVQNTSVPIVLDADGLNAFAENPAELRGEIGAGKTTTERTLVLTPHPGEMSRLLGGLGTAQIQADRKNVAVSFAREHNLILVLKGHRTIIANHDGDIVVNVTGNPGMAKGGSGDVLTGITAALVARHSGQLYGVSLAIDHSPETAEIASMMKRFKETGDQALGLEIWHKAQPKLNSIQRQLHFLAVSIAVGLHGLAGDIARDLHGEYSMSATHIIHSLGEAIALAQQESVSRFGYLQR